MEKKFCFTCHAANPKLLISLIIVVTIFTSFSYLINDNGIAIPTKYLQENYGVENARCEILRRKPIKYYHPDYVDIESATNKTEENINCFRIKSNSLPDISEMNPRPDKSIFFHETSCRSYREGKIRITSRQACAVESAARLNPNFDVYLVYASPGIFKFDCDESDFFLRAIFSYDNVNVVHMDYGDYVKNTPVESLYDSGTLERSEHAVAHASDILRYVTLWKYGGIYLDLDVIILKSLENLKLNFAAVQSDTEVAAGVLSFDASGDGHRWVETCLNDLKTNFTGKDWSDSSVGVITRLLQSLCGQSTVPGMMESDCRGFNLLSQNTFYSLPYQYWFWYFSKEEFQYVKKITETSYALHMWNKMSSNRKIYKKAPGIPYTYFAEKFCPKVFKACDTFF